MAELSLLDFKSLKCRIKATALWQLSEGERTKMYGVSLVVNVLHLCTMYSSFRKGYLRFISKREKYLYVGVRRGELLY